MTIRFFCSRKNCRQERLLKFSRKVCQELKISKSRGELSLVFVSDRAIRKINKTFLGRNRATDVIAFPYRDEPSHNSQLQTHNEPMPFGDIYISLDTAERQAKKQNYPLRNELALLIVHGLLHLIGYRDGSAKQKKRMFALQRRLFRKINPRLAPPDFG